MKHFQRILSACLLLLLCLSMTAPALAYETVTDTYRRNVVLVTYENNDASGAKTKRVGTGVVIGSVTDPADCVVLIHSEVICNSEGSVNVDVKVLGKNKKTYTGNECHMIDGTLAVINTSKFYDQLTPLPLRAASTLTANQELRLISHGDNNIYAYTNGRYNGREAGISQEQALFGEKDIKALAGRQKANSTYVYGTPIVAGSGVVGLSMRLMEGVNSVYFLGAEDLASLLALHNISYATIGEFPTPSPTATKTNGPTAAPTVTHTMEPGPTPTPGLSTVALVGIIGGAVVLIGVVVLLLVMAKRKKDAIEQQGSGDMGKTAPVQPVASYKLVGVAGELSGREYPLVSKLVIGRDPKVCDVKLNASTPGVSGVHCRVVLSNGKVLLTDLNSSYGTLKADGSKLAANESVALHRGDSFYLGSKNNGFTLQ